MIANNDKFRVDLWDFDKVFNKVKVQSESEMKWDDYLKQPEQGLLWISAGVEEKTTKELCVANLGGDEKDDKYADMR